ncbi:hypothetical protein Tco_0454510 [Tanacetum coccineum]
MLDENQDLQRQLLQKQAKELESLQARSGTIVWEQIEAKLVSKYEVTMKQERAMSYSFSHQVFHSYSAAMVMKSRPNIIERAITDMWSSSARINLFLLRRISEIEQIRLVFGVMQSCRSVVAFGNFLQNRYYNSVILLQVPFEQDQVLEVASGCLDTSQLCYLLSEGWSSIVSLLNADLMICLMSSTVMT